jgi:hypothetical protein
MHIITRKTEWIIGCKWVNLCNTKFLSQISSAHINNELGAYLRDKKMSCNNIKYKQANKIVGEYLVITAKG